MFRGTRSGGTWSWNPIRGSDKACIGWRVSCISVLDSTHAYACTGNPSKPHGGGTIIATSNGSLTWSRIRYCARIPGWKLPDALLGVNFADTSHGWAVGTTEVAGGAANPLMIATSNGGAGWTDISSKLPASFIPRAVSAGDANNVWICGASGKIYRSTDGGNTWALANSGAPAVDYTCIWVKSSEGAFAGWAAGNSGKIVRTENGSDWTVEAAGLTTSDITDLAVYSQDCACAAYGATSFLTYTRTSGWAVESTGFAPIVSAASTDGSNGVAVGGTRYIFADSDWGWSAVCTVADTPWRLRYLVTRLDGYSDDSDSDGLPDDVKAIIDRACAATSPGKFVLDEATKLDNGQVMSTDVFEAARDALMPIVGASQITWDRTATFLTHQTNVMGYASWGLHDYYANTYTSLGRPFNAWANGGIGVVIESTDGRGFHLPYYAWALYRGGTAYANKLSLDGWWNSTQYAGYKLALLASTDQQLASGTLAGGKVQIGLTGLSWPADHLAYVQLYFPANDPLHPGAPMSMRVIPGKVRLRRSMTTGRRGLRCW